ncbi:hypothetical protein B0J17DRAFT_42508 [Rhizoctonia solani]|nr:hypothetical protein B0J17DRAFT_42508 [Rhizoctonia solani]
MNETARHYNKNRIESGIPRTLNNTSRPAGHEPETIDFIENRGDCSYYLDASTSDSFSNQLSQDPLAHNAADNPDMFAANTNRTREPNSLGNIDMGETWLTSWLANDEDRTFSLSWGLNGTAASWQQSFHNPLSESNLLSSLGDINPMLALPSHLLDINESVAPLPTASSSFDASTLPHPSQSPGVQRYYEATKPNEIMETSRGFNEVTLKCLLVVPG